MKFDPLFLSPQWLQEYHTKYPHGMAVLENIIEWVNQTNKLIDYVNVTPDKVKEILQLMVDDGTLEGVVDEVLLGNVMGILNSMPYNISRDVSTGTDISDYLINLLLTKKNIYIPAGSYTISKTILIPEDVTISGDGVTSILHFINGGRIRPGYATTFENFKITAEDTFTGDIFYLDSWFVNDSGKQKSNIKIRNIFAYKEYNAAESIFIHLHGAASGNILNIPGFWGALFEDITVDGFSIPAKISLLDGWIHTNDFINWRVESFKHAIVLDGQKSSPEKDDSRIRRNKFHNWTVQPDPATTTQIFVQNKDFPNDYKSIDVWDVVRWLDTTFIEFGNIPVTDFNDDKGTINNRRHGVNYLTERYYPITRKIADGSTMYVTLTYSEGTSSYCEIDITDDIITIRESPGFSRKFEFYKDSAGTIYIKVNSTAFGSLYYKNLRNAATYPYYNFSAAATFTPTMTEIIPNYKYIVEGYLTDFSDEGLGGGATGAGGWYQNGDVVTISGRFNTEAYSSSTAAFIVPDPLAGEIGSITTGDYRISSSGFVYLKPGVSRLEINMSYIRSR